MTSSSTCLGMDLTTNTTTAPAAAATSSAVKTPELAETEIPSRIQQPKTFPFSNGVSKRKNHHPVVVIYRECLKNHAASLGTHAVDGCGEFLPIPAANPADPTSLKCAACGCHRNFHRRDPEEPQPIATAALEYQSHHRHHPPPPRGDHSSPNSSPSPPPISSAYYPASAPHMLLALSAGFSGEKNPNPATPTPPPAVANSNGRKRFRTKFTSDQKVKMLEFAEKVEWKMQKRDEDLVNNFCNEIGVEKGVLKVWMHNNKNTSGSGKKLDQSSTGQDNHQHPNGNINNVVNGFCIVTKNKTHHDNTDSEFHLHHESSMNDNKKGFSSFDANNFVATNGSSSSS